MRFVYFIIGWLIVLMTLLVAFSMLNLVLQTGIAIYQSIGLWWALALAFAPPVLLWQLFILTERFRGK